MAQVPSSCMAWHVVAQVPSSNHPLDGRDHNTGDHNRSPPCGERLGSIMKNKNSQTGPASMCPDWTLAHCKGLLKCKSWICKHYDKCATVGCVRQAAVGSSLCACVVEKKMQAEPLHQLEKTIIWPFSYRAVSCCRAWSRCARAAYSSHP